MSADNYVFIDRKKKPLEVWSCVASQVSNNIQDQKCRLIGKVDTLEKALDMANEEWSEYGIFTELWAK